MNRSQNVVYTTIVLNVVRCFGTDVFRKKSMAIESGNCRGWNANRVPCCLEESSLFVASFPAIVAPIRVNFARIFQKHPMMRLPKVFVHFTDR